MRIKDTTKQWWRAAGMRAVKTFAQALVAALPATAATIGSVDWATAVGTAALAAVLSLLTSVAGLPELPDGTEAKAEAKPEEKAADAPKAAGEDEKGAKAE